MPQAVFVKEISVDNPTILMGVDRHILVPLIRSENVKWYIYVCMYV